MGAPSRIRLEGSAYLEKCEPAGRWALYRDGEFLRYLDRFECEFVNCAIVAAIAG